MKLRGISKRGTLIDFTLRNEPLAINNREFVLRNCRNSDIIRLDSIVRGESSYNIYEGDMVYDLVENQSIGVVVYCAGFKLLTKDGSLIPIPVSGRYRIINGDKESIKQILSLPDRTEVSVRFGNRLVTLQALLSMHSTYLLYDKGMYDTQKFYSGICNQEMEPYCFGEFIKENEIILSGMNVVLKGNKGQTKLRGIKVANRSELY